MDARSKDAPMPEVHIHQRAGGFLVADYIATACGCRLTGVYSGHKRPKRCKVHGNLFEKVRPAGSKVSKPKREPTRDWSYAIAKVEGEKCCRVCGSDLHVEAAHVMGRAHDEPASPGSPVLFVRPERIVPLCGPFPDGCHGEYDGKRLDLLPYLKAEEQAQAVLDAGGITPALKRLAPVSYNREVAEAAA